MVVVTGASGGIGRALAIELGAGGCRLGLIARRGPELQETAALVRSQGGEAHAATADVGDRRALREAIGALEEALGPTQVLVANAGFGAPTRLDPLNIDDVEQTFRVNVMGVIYSVEAVLPGMLARGDGHLVAVSSLAALKGLPGESAYCASKAAVNTYMEGLRIALRSRGVAVATVCPGFVDTLIEPMDTAATPFLISAEAAAKKIARVIDARKSGVFAFPWRMAALTALIARLPDFLVARLIGEGGAGP
ncbi:SDR family NAD(P)-dependent oxidoreductase [Paludisphaera borealis]|nr:SDR family NAD(P)-dependent oxidoreductase [Paludisphaera borealis]